MLKDCGGSEHMASVEISSDTVLLVYKIDGRRVIVAELNSPAALALADNLIDAVGQIGRRTEQGDKW